MTRFIDADDRIRDVRVVLTPDGEKNVYLLQKATANPTDISFVNDDRIKYVTYDWSENETVYHFWDDVPSIALIMPLIPCGHLHYAENTLVLNPLYVLRVTHDLRQGSATKKWGELIQTLSLICDVDFIQRDERNSSGHKSNWRISPTLYIICKNQTDLTTAKIIFPDGELFMEHTQ